MGRACGVLLILGLAGCGELAESRIERPTHQTAEEAARAQVEELFARGAEGHAELADLLRHPDVTGEHLEAVGQVLLDHDRPQSGRLELLAEPLVALAEDATRPLDDRQWALASLHGLGMRARPVATRIWPLLDDEELFANAWGALMKMRWEPLIDVLIRTLDSDHRGYRSGAIEHLGEFGQAAARAVPALSRKLLGEEPFAERVQVIEALKRIGTAEARAALVAAIESPRWLDVKHATLAVLELSIFEAEPVLRRVSRRHWRAGIRHLTQVGAEVLDRRRRGEPPRTNHIKFGNGCYDDRSKPVVVEREGRRLEVPYIERTKPPARPAGFPSVVSLGDEESCIRAYERLESGWAVAVDCGEWGGSVVYAGDDGAKYALSPMSCDQFVRLGDRLFAIGGCNHLGLNDGYIVEVLRGADGRWRARELAQPVGTPQARLITAEGLILAGPHGATLLRPDGTQEEVDCVLPK